MGLSVKDELRL